MCKYNHFKLICYIFEHEGGKPMKNIFETLRLNNHLTAKGLSEIFKREGFNVDRNKINRLEGGQIPDGEALKAYSKYFNVSSDFLLGLLPAESMDADIRMISRYTGLDDTAIKTLHNFKHYIGVLFNDMIQTVEGRNLFNKIATYLYYPDIEKIQLKHPDETISNIWLHKDDTLYFLFRDSDNPHEIDIDKFKEICLWEDIKEALHKLKDIIPKEGD